MGIIRSLEIHAGATIRDSTWVTLVKEKPISQEAMLKLSRGHT